MNDGRTADLNDDGQFELAARAFFEPIRPAFYGDTTFGFGVGATVGEREGTPALPLLSAIRSASQDLVGPLLVLRGQILEVSSLELLPAIPGDRQRLVQVVVNLLANASKFSPPGTTIRIGGEHTSPASVTFWIEDEGPGPADPDDAKLFDQFHRSGGEDPDESGLGLGRTMKVLLVDDDLDLIAITTFALQQAGFFVIRATDGEQAIARVEGEIPDVIVLDINLPRRNGFDVAQTVRRESSVPIIMLTARGEEDDLVKALKLGADDYLTKPFSPKVLVARIQAMLRRSPGRAPVREDCA